ncbi:MAG: hypothetical protein QOE22_233 [Candidatus Parcubacteria bacterium]|jgi:hypothetical protein|nr:hypothetical protein [Candidatus Parcubacteria bacterium]
MSKILKWVACLLLAAFLVWIVLTDPLLKGIVRTVWNVAVATVTSFLHRQ